MDNKHFLELTLQYRLLEKEILSNLDVDSETSNTLGFEGHVFRA